MRVSILQEQFAEALSIAIRAIDGKPVVPVLGNVLLRTVDASLELVGTNFATSIVVSIGAKIDIPGSITLPAKTLAELVKNLPEERVDLTLDDATQTVKFACGLSKGSIKGIAASEFPIIEAPAAWDTELPALVLKTMIENVAFCAAKEDNRPILKGISTTLTSGCLTMACADGYRLAVQSVPVDNAHEFAATIPADAMTDFAKLLNDKHEVQMALAGDKLHLQTGRVTYTIQLLEGRFPDYNALLPHGYATQVTAYTDDLLKACVRSEIFSRDSNYSSRLNIQAGTPGGMFVVGKSAERGDLEAVLDIQTEGANLEVAFNVRYLIDVLKHVHTEQVILESHGAAYPGLITLPDRSVQYVIMPMSLRN